MVMTILSEQILALRAKGKTYNEIRDELGCSKGTISYYLSEQGKQKNAQRQTDRRRAARRLIQETKQNTPCADCGENYPFWMMDFDHLGDKSFNISRWYDKSGNSSKLVEEIAKCDVVCANCHRNRTHSRQVLAGNGEWLYDVSEFYA